MGRVNRLTFALFASIVWLHASVWGALPGFGSWQNPTSIPSARASIAIARDDQGLVYLAGGIVSFENFLNRVDVYNPAQNSWSTLPNMPIAVEGAAAAVANDNLYVFGGRAIQFKLQLIEQKYSFATHTWQVEPFELAGWNAACTEPGDGLVYMMGGLKPNNRIAADGIYFDPVADVAGNATPPMIFPRQGLQAQLIDGKLYAFGGFTTSETPTSSLEFYDKAVGGWSPLARMITPRTNFASAANGAYLLAAGGSNNPYDTFINCFDAFEAYDSATNKWFAGPAMPERLRSTCGTFVNGRFYVFGGYTDTGTGISAQVYSIAVPEPSALQASIVMVLFCLGLRLNRRRFDGARGFVDVGR